MADALVKPAFVSTFPDSGDVTKFGPTAWNAPRLFSGGTDGDVLVRDPASTTGASWAPPSGAAGPEGPAGPTGPAGPAGADGGSGSGPVAEVALGTGATVLKEAPATAMLGVYDGAGALANLNVRTGTQGADQHGILFGLNTDQGSGGWLKYRAAGEGMFYFKCGDDSQKSDVHLRNAITEGIDVATGRAQLGVESASFWYRYILGFRDAGDGPVDAGIMRNGPGSVRAVVSASSPPSAENGEFVARNFRCVPGGAVKPAASVDVRGTLWHTYGGAGVADTVEVCVKTAADTYIWQTVI